jgi:hypothetical protein
MLGVKNNLIKPKGKGRIYLRWFGVVIQPSQEIEFYGES